MSFKGWMLYWVDAAILLLMLALSGTGVLLRWVLPHGQGGGAGGGPRGGGGGGMGRGWGGGHGPGAGLGEAVAGGHADWLGYTRHEWGDLHFWIAVALLAGILTHLVLHLGWILASTKRLFRRSPKPLTP